MIITVWFLWACSVALIHPSLFGPVLVFFFFFFLPELNRSSRERDRFTVRPSDYISDSVTAPSSTATVSPSHTHTHTCGRYCTCWLCYLAVQVLTGGHRPAAVLSWGRVLTVVIHRHLQEDILQSVSITLSSAGCEDDRDLVSRKYAQSTLPLWSSTIQRCDCGAVPEVRAGSNWEG